MARQIDPETERKRAWLNRYRESIAEQKRLAETLQELRSRATSICAPLCAARSAPTGAHSDRVADSVQRIADMEQRLQAEQAHGADIATEIINVLYDQLPIKYARVMCCRYMDGMNADQTAQELSMSVNTVFVYCRAALAQLQLPENAL